MTPQTIEKAKSPTIITVLGATGDLTRRKLIPALFDLYIRDLLPKRFRIVGFARTPHTDSEYQEIVREIIQKKGHKHSKKSIDTFVKKVSYQAGDFTKSEGYGGLSDLLISIENGFGQCSNKLFYLAVPPKTYKDIFHNLADSGLTIPCSQETGWTRVLVEKPFGKDSKTAQELDKMLGMLFKEEQIFRIDHYLGKETLQDILMFRFSNLIFEPLWNNKYIEKVEINFLERIGVNDRGAFYDGIGALRDVGQNHMLQMLTFVAMEDPDKFEASAIRAERAKVLKALVPFNNSNSDLVRGQYKGYLEEKNVDAESKTETYFKFVAYIDNDRWRSVPFIFKSGKALQEKRSEIKIYFKKTEGCFCPPEDPCEHVNVLIFRIQPNEGISILFWANKSGFTGELEPKELSFSYKTKDKEIIPDAYEKILFDAIVGDQTLFTSTEEVSAAWKFITPIIENWEDTPLQIYKKGTKPS